AIIGWPRRLLASLFFRCGTRPRVPHLVVEALEQRMVPTLLGNALFPVDNPWNEKITSAPVAANSTTLVASIGLTSAMHADFGSGLSPGGDIGIPFNVVPRRQPTITGVIEPYA